MCISTQTEKTHFILPSEVNSAFDQNYLNKLKNSITNEFEYKNVKILDLDDEINDLILDILKK